MSRISPLALANFLAKYQANMTTTKPKLPKKGRRSVMAPDTDEQPGLVPTMNQSPGQNVSFASRFGACRLAPVL